MRSLALFAVILGPILTTRAELVSSTWRSPNITAPRADRVSIAGAAIDHAIGLIGADGQFDDQSDWGVAGNLYSQMADFDLAANQTKYRDALTAYFIQATKLRPNLSDPLAYGRAAVRAFTAYKDPVFLEYAVQPWAYAQTYTLSPEVLAAGQTDASGKNFLLHAECNGRTMAGGTFGNAVNGTGLVSSRSTGVSALLAEATGNVTYMQAAMETAEFILAHLLNDANQVQDAISSVANASCQPSPTLRPFNFGGVIEGLSVLYSITKNTTLQAILEGIVTATIPNAAWQGSNGVVNFKGVGDLALLQGLSTACTRNSISPELRADVEKYIAVQFNAIVDLATVNGSDIYSSSWLGPPTSVFNPGSQTTALSALVGAIDLLDPSGTSSPAPVVSAPPPEPSNNASHVGAIVGGLLAGVAVGAGVLALWILRRRRLSGKTSSPEDPEVTEVRTTPSTLDPFVSRPTHHASSYKAPTVPPRPEIRRSIHKARMRMGIDPRTDSVDIRESSVGSETALPSSVPTEELVRMLNERLQGREWDEGEAPPNYRTHVS
ncbi:hypothetical protein C8R46DRAFT_1140582 [Mycena filopes]|nr:hypothetical protein C8R46DRAFT_1140582 [Mycena filopes]